MKELSAIVETMIILRIDLLFLKHETMNRLYALIHAMDDEEEKHYELTKLKMTLTAQFADTFAIEHFVQIFTNIIQQLMVWVVPEKKENSAILTLIYEYVQKITTKTCLYNLFQKNSTFLIVIFRLFSRKNTASTLQNI